MDHLHDSRPNHVFELAGTKYLPRPEPAARGSKKNKAGAVSKAEAVPRKSGGAKTQGGGGGGLSQGREKKPKRELLLARLLRPKYW
jgi:hypothetical protein